MRATLLALLAVLPWVFTSTLARAEENALQQRERELAAEEAARAPKPKEKPDEPLAVKSGYAQFFATAMVGTGFRFNNPYRLATPLGDDAESVSRTATYADLGLAATFLGNPLGFQHGAAARVSIAAEGVGQVVLTPSYFVWRRFHRFAAFGRAGVPIVMTPETTWGLEAGVGGAFFVLGGIGIAAEIIGDLYYGAGTQESRVVTYPVLSGQIGIITALEMLP